jgi:hypothetical protein
VPPPAPGGGGVSSVWPRWWSAAPASRRGPQAGPATASDPAAVRKPMRKHRAVRRVNVRRGPRAPAGASSFAFILIGICWREEHEGVRGHDSRLAALRSWLRRHIFLLAGSAGSGSDRGLYE